MAERTGLLQRSDDARSLPDDLRRVFDKADDSGRRIGNDSGIDDQIHLFLEAVANVFWVGHGVIIAGENQGRTEQWLVQFRYQRQRDRIVRQADTDGFALRMLQATRRFAGRFENKGERPRRQRFDQSECFVVDLRESRYLRQIPADQGEIVIFLQLANSADAVQPGFIIHLTAERVGGIGRINDYAPFANDLDASANEPSLRVVRVDLKILSHPDSLL